MKSCLALAALAAACLLAGCSTYGSLQAQPAKGQKSTYQDGRETLVSIQKNIVGVVPAKVVIDDDDDNLYFVVGFENRSKHAIVFSTANITAAYTDPKDGPEALQVYSYAQLVRDQLDDEKSAARWAAIGGALASVASSYSTTTTNYSGSAYASNGVSVYGSGTSTSTTYNPAAGIAAASRTDARIARIHAQAERNLQATSNGALKIQTVPPGEWYGGVVAVESPGVEDQPQPIRLTVKVDGEVHQFEFILKEDQDD